MSDPYATHIATLAAVGKDVRFVLELGAGRYSTKVFLDYQFYPKLERLVSIEHDSEWIKILKKEIEDGRLELIHVNEPIEDFLKTIDLTSFDLIFVDNSTSSERRIATIQFLAAQNLKCKVVLHDYDYAPYREAAGGFKNKVVYQEEIPNTAVVWND